MTNLYVRAADAIQRGWEDDGSRRMCLWCGGKTPLLRCSRCGYVGEFLPPDATHRLNCCPQCGSDLAEPVPPDEADITHATGCELAALLAELDAAQAVADRTRERAIADCAGYLRVKAARRRKMGSLLNHEVAAELECEANALDHLTRRSEGGALRLLADVVIDLRRPEQGVLPPWKDDLLRRAEGLIDGWSETRVTHILRGLADTAGAAGTISGEERQALLDAAEMLEER